MTRPRWSWIAAGLVAGGIVALLAGRRPAPELTGARLAEARARWEATGPASYEVEIETSGAVAARHWVEVEDGRAFRMTTGGAAVPLSAAEYWTVDGLFGFLEQELGNAAHPRQAFGVEDPDLVVLRARFHPRWGYPETFLRHVMGRQRQGVEWRVTKFEARDG